VILLPTRLRRTIAGGRVLTVKRIRELNAKD